MRTDWLEIELGQVCNIISGRNQKNVINPNGKYPIYGSAGIFGYSDDFLCEPGTTIIGRKGTINSPLYVNEKFWNVDTAFGLSPKELINNKFLYFFCRSFNFHKLDKSTTIPSLAKRDLEKIIIPISPLPEQRAIVSKIEQLFSELDNGIDNLKTAKEKLEIYRQAILKKAFENLSKSDYLGDIAEVKRGKSKHRPRNDKSLFGGKYPFIQTGEIRSANGGTINSYKATYSEKGLDQSKLWPKGTLCLTIAANIGETAFLGFDACFPDSVVGINPIEEKLNIKYLNFYIQKIKVEIDSQASATAQKNINVKFLENLQIPLPNNVKKQISISQKIEYQFSVCDKVADSINESLEKSEALRQSILKKAFSGELLTEKELDACKQEADWEPAEKLLERIKKD